MSRTTVIYAVLVSLIMCLLWTRSDAAAIHACRKCPNLRRPVHVRRPASSSPRVCQGDRHLINHHRVSHWRRYSCYCHAVRLKTQMVFFFSIFMYNLSNIRIWPKQRIWHDLKKSTTTGIMISSSYLNIGYASSSVLCIILKHFTWILWHICYREMFSCIHL